MGRYFYAALNLNKTFRCFKWSGKAAIAIKISFRNGKNSFSSSDQTKNSETVHGECTGENHKWKMMMISFGKENTIDHSLWWKILWKLLSDLISRNYRTEFFSKFFIDGNELKNALARLPTSIKWSSTLNSKADLQFWNDSNDSRS